MKKLLQILFFAAMTFVASKSFAQTGQTGTGLFDIENIWFCDDSTSTSFYRTIIHRVGFTSIVTGTFAPNGTAYTPSTQIDAGPCPGASTGADSSYAYYFTELCDMTVNPGIPYIAVFKIATKNSSGAVSRYKLGNYNHFTGLTYTPSGGGNNAAPGFCEALTIVSGTNVEVLMTTGSSGTLTQGQVMNNVDILNSGNNTAQLTINSDTFNLFPGMRWFCHAKFNESTRVYDECPAVIYNGNYLSKSTTLHITRTQ